MADGVVTGITAAVALMATTVVFMYLTASTYWAIILDTVADARVGGVSGFVHLIANLAGIVAIFRGGRRVAAHLDSSPQDSFFSRSRSRARPLSASGRARRIIARRFCNDCTIKDIKFNRINKINISNYKSTLLLVILFYFDWDCVLGLFQQITLRGAFQ
jgi:hypothetical protein